MGSGSFTDARRFGGGLFKCGILAERFGAQKSDSPAGQPTLLGCRLSSRTTRYNTGGTCPTGQALRRRNSAAVIALAYRLAKRTAGAQTTGAVARSARQSDNFLRSPSRRKCSVTTTPCAENAISSANSPQTRQRHNSPRSTTRPARTFAPHSAHSPSQRTLLCAPGRPFRRATGILGAITTYSGLKTLRPAPSFRLLGSSFVARDEASAGRRFPRIPGYVALSHKGDVLRAPAARKYIFMSQNKCRFST